MYLGSNNNNNNKMVFNPHKDLKKVQKKLFSGAVTNNCSAKINLWRPIVNIREQDNNIIISFELPGLNKDNINIECTKDNSIIITGEKKGISSPINSNSGAAATLGVSTNFPKSSEYSEVLSPTNLNTKSIITIGKFIRSYRLPHGTDYSKIKATMEDGILEITIPKENVEDKYKVSIQSKL